MSAQVSEGEWVPLPGAVPDVLDPETIYVIPTRSPLNAEGVPRYTESVRLLPKKARAAKVPVEFSVPSGSREYLAEYSVEPEVWVLGLACLQLANDWLIVAVSHFISLRAQAQGWTAKEAQQRPLRVLVSETESSRNFQIEGSGDDVLKALKLLQKDPTNKVGKTRRKHGNE